MLAFSLKKKTVSRKVYAQQNSDNYLILSWSIFNHYLTKYPTSWQCIGEKTFHQLLFHTNNLCKKYHTAVSSPYNCSRCCSCLINLDTLLSARASFFPGTPLMWSKGTLMGSEEGKWGHTPPAQRINVTVSSATQPCVPQLQIKPGWPTEMGRTEPFASASALLCNLGKFDLFPTPRFPHLEHGNNFLGFFLKAFQMNSPFKEVSCIISNGLSCLPRTKSDMREMKFRPPHQQSMLTWPSRQG